MKRVRIERKSRRWHEDRHEVLSLDPRDPDVVRAKQLRSGRARVSAMDS